MMNRFVVCSWVPMAVLSLSSMGFAGTPEIVVSPAGAISTPADALKKVRELRAAGSLARDEVAVVRFEAGTYRLSRPLLFTAEDSNVRFEGARTGRTVFRGGEELGCFTAGEDGIWRTQVPKNLKVEQLWVGGVRAHRAVSPNGDVDYHHIRFNVASSNGCLVAEEDYPLLERLAALPPDQLTNVAVHVYYAWDTEWLRPDRIDPKTGFVGFTASPARDFFLWKKWLPRFKVENYRAALDEPGEWFVDRKRDELLYIPRKGECVESARPFVPTVEKLLVVAGDEVKGDRVRNVSFVRIEFSGNAWFMPNALAPRQAAQNVAAAVEVTEAREVWFEKCRFDKTSTYAIWFGKGCRESGVRDSLFTDLGAGGVRIGTFKRTTDVPADLFEGAITVDNNIITGGGLLFPEAVGVQIVYAADCRITHNEISDLFYTGISIGWGWNYTPTQNRRNYIAYNNIHDLGKGVLCDMGGIYHLSEDTGTVIEGNVIHGIRSYRYTGAGGTGIYMDEASSGIAIVSNLVYDTQSGAAHQHYGRDNAFCNNILAYSQSTALTRIRVEDHRSFSFKNNIVVWGKNANAIRVGDTKKGIDFGGNLYWSTAGRGGSAFDNLDFDEWMADGGDRGSVFADPKFRDPENGDFSLAADSPAFGAGFVPWEISKAGVRGDAWRRKAESFVMRPAVVIPEPRRYLGIPEWRSDFGAQKVGARPKFPLRAHGSPIEVVGDPSTRGGRAMKISDSKSKPGFDPYLTCDIPYAEKRLTFEYSLKYAEDANFVQEWREHKGDCRNGQYATGLWVRANGKSFAVSGSVPDGKGGYADRDFILPNARPGEWMRCRLTMAFERGKRVRCELTLEDASGGRSTTGEFFAFDEFVNPNWTAFFAWGGVDTTYLLDDIYYKAE